MEGSSSPPPLAAFLLNPPTGTGCRTVGRLGVAAEILGCAGAIRIANLVDQPTKGLHDLAVEATDPQHWDDSFQKLFGVFTEPHTPLIGWGVSRPPGIVGQYAARQQERVLRGLLASGHTAAWTLLGQPRHPSRWHQFTSEKYPHATGTGFVERLRSVLVLTDLEHLLPN